VGWSQIIRLQKCGVFFPNILAPHTDKKVNQIFLIYKEIQSGAVAKSYMRKGFLIHEKIKKNAQIFPHV
jgi:hypothetical protein